jgi:amino acid adenylation domain-containing protein
MNLNAIHWPRDSTFHSIRLRIAEGTLEEVKRECSETVERVLGPVARATARKLPALLYERCSYPSCDARAARVCAEEMLRPLAATSRSICRLTVLHFSDGAADVVVVANRLTLDTRSIHCFAHAVAKLGVSVNARKILEPEAGGNVLMEPSDGDQLYEPLAVPAWGLGGRSGDPGVGRIIGGDLPTDIEESVFAALNVVLARLGGSERGMVAVLGAAGEDTLGANEIVAGWRLVSDPSLSVTHCMRTVNMRLTTLFHQRPGGARPDGRVNPEDIRRCAFGIFGNFGKSNPIVGHYAACLTPMFPMTIEIQNTSANGCRLSYIFDRKCFHPGMVTTLDRAVITVHQNILEALRAERTDGVGIIRLLSQAQALSVANLTSRRDRHHEASRIDARFKEICRWRGQSPAVSFEGETLTYAELDRVSDRVAQRLRILGVNSGDNVGVLLDRSLELIPLFLGILKAGAAYVPFDPAHPADRLTFTITEANLAILVTQSQQQQSAKAANTVTPGDLTQESHDDAAYHPQPYGAEDPAYIIFTSGSTGRPKGVVVPHANVVALIDGVREEFQLTGADVWTMFHSPAFDFSIWEIWGCLLTGGHLVIVPYWVSRSPEDLVRLLVNKRVSVLSQTPSAFSQLQEEDRRGNSMLRLRLVIFGGERLDCASLRSWFDRHPEDECRLVNMYGITETTVHVTMETITRQHVLEASRVVGHPIPGWYCHIKDSQGHLLPVGVPGEIYVGGCGVARGYFGRPDLSRERFQTDEMLGGRLYRSGDRGRLLEDGRIEHLGRLDRQIKIRGFRIELDEIQAILLQCPAVSTAAVVFRQTSPDDHASARLDAYVVLRGGSIDDVRSYAGRWLAEYMLPSISLVEHLPLTVNGKLDTVELSSAATSEAIQPRTKGTRSPSEFSLETTLQHVWESVMGRACGVEDSFFELGGNSLYAVRILAALRNEKLPNLSVRELYASQTIRRVAHYLTHRELKGSAETV